MMYGQPQAYNYWQGNQLIIPPVPAGPTWPRSTPVPSGLLGVAQPSPGSVQGLLANVPMSSDAGRDSVSTGPDYGAQAGQSAQGGQSSGPNMGYGRAGGMVGTAASALSGVPGLGIGLGLAGTAFDVANANAALTDLGMSRGGLLGVNEGAQAFFGDLLSGPFDIFGNWHGLNSVSQSYNDRANALSYDSLMGNWTDRALTDTQSYNAANIDGPSQGYSSEGDTGSTAESSAADAAAAAAEAAASAMGIDGAMGNGGDGSGGGSGAKIICNELHRQGLMPDDIWAADEAFGEWLSANDPAAMAGYLAWAPWVVRQISGAGKWSAFVRMVTLWIVNPWSRHMAYKMGALPKDNLAGRAIMAVGRLGCRWVGATMIARQGICF